MLALGIVMLYSIGAFARDAKGDSFYFLKRQSVYLVIGVAGFIFAAMLDYQFWRKAWAVCFVTSLVCLALCFVPGVGMMKNGAYRWLNLGITSFQPSEFAKFSACIFLA